MFRIEKLIAISTIGLFILLLSMSMVLQQMLPVYWLWSNHASEGKHFQISSIGAWQQQISQWQWVDKYQLKWTFPGFIQMHIVSKTPVLKIGEYTYVDQYGHAFMHNKRNDNLVSAQLHPSAYADVIEWVAYFKQHGLILAQVTQSASQLVDFNFTTGAQLSIYGSQTHLMPWVGTILQPLQSGQSCYLYSTSSIACHP
ncbi:hypothetical protein OAT84_03020 [Gammaproteobacteria bacterium]|nr:hypothetical protein [Gammaproteobacteria bacterium]